MGARRRLLNGTKDIVREADAWSMVPDVAMGEIADLLVTGVRHLGEAFAHLEDPGDGATCAADAAVKSQRAVERVYRQGMSRLLEHPDPREVLGRQELYSGLLAVSSRVSAVAERVWYAVVKESWSRPTRDASRAQRFRPRLAYSAAHAVAASSNGPLP